MKDVPDTFLRKPRHTYPDRTRRAYEAINLHYQAIGMQAVGKWVAVRMSDGGSDGRLYESKEEAVRFQLHRNQCMYVPLPSMGTMSLKEIHGLFIINEKADAAEREHPHLHVRLPFRG